MLRGYTELLSKWLSAAFAQKGDDKMKKSTVAGVCYTIALIGAFGVVGHFDACPYAPITDAVMPLLVALSAGAIGWGLRP